MPKVTIYTRAFCGYCSRALALLQEKGLSVEEIDITMDPKKREEMIERAKGGYTVPQIFVGDTHIGGCTDLLSLDGAGKFDELLLTQSG
jgi:glutaredoxin 3